MKKRLKKPKKEEILERNSECLMNSKINLLKSKIWEERRGEQIKSEIERVCMRVYVCAWERERNET